MSDSTLSISAAWERAALSERGQATLMVRLSAARPAGQPEKERVPLDIAFVLDRSGSMTGSKIELVKQAVDLATKLLDESDRAALVVYDDQIDVLRTLECATLRAKTAMRLALQQVDARGSTNLCDGWLTGCQQLTRGLESASTSETRIRRSLLLTDGLANVGETSMPALTNHAHELRKRGIGTTTLGVGDDFDETLLSSLAEAGGGNFQFIASPGQLPAFFQRELGELMTIIASRVNVRLTLPKGLRAELVNPYPVNREGKQIDVAIGEIPARDEIFLIFAVSAKAATAGTRFAPSLSVRWTDPTKKRRVTTDVEVPALSIVDEATLRTMPVDREVAEQSALQRAAAEQRDAMRLDREGRYQESRAVHQRAYELLLQAPDSPVVQQRAQEARAYAEYDPSFAFSSEMRKRSVFDSMRRTRGKRDA